jgi:hypothetical protein
MQQDRIVRCEVSFIFAVKKSSVSLELRGGGI